MITSTRSLVVTMMLLIMCNAFAAQGAAGTPVQLCQGNVREIVSAGNQSFFIAEGATTGIQLWITDGTVQGTRMMTSQPGNVAIEQAASLSPNLAVDDQGRAFFSRSTPWVSDGTPSGTKKIADVTGLLGVITLGTKAFFGIISPKKGLLVTDGTAAGTQVLKSFDTALIASNLNILGITSQYVFFAYSKSDGTNNDSEVWRSDGTVAGTIKLSTHRYYENLILPYLCHSYGNTFYFPVDEGNACWNLWQSDGTVSGTKRITNAPLHANFRICRIQSFKNRIYYAAVDQGGNRNLYECNETTSGSTTIATLIPYSDSHYFDLPRFSDATDNLMIFHLGDKTFISDGTAKGTWPLAFKSGYGSSTRFVRVPRRPLWFCAGMDTAHGTELWMTDGTDAGTRFAADMIPGTGSSDPFNFTICNQKILYTPYNYIIKSLWAVPMPALPNAVRSWTEFQ